MIFTFIRSLLVKKERETSITLENFKGGDERHEVRTVEI